MSSDYSVGQNQPPVGWGSSPGAARPQKRGAVKMAAEREASAVPIQSGTPPEVPVSSQSITQISRPEQQSGLDPKTAVRGVQSGGKRAAILPRVEVGPSAQQTAWSSAQKSVSPRSKGPSMKMSAERETGGSSTKEAERRQGPPPAPKGAPSLRAEASDRSGRSMMDSLVDLGEKIDRCTNDDELDTLTRLFENLTSSKAYAKEIKSDPTSAKLRQRLEDSCAASLLKKRLLLHVKGMSEDEAQRIADGLVRGGEEFVQEEKVQYVETTRADPFTGEKDVSVKRYEGEPLGEGQTLVSKTLLRQTHGIEGMKVYKDPQTGKMVADFGERQLAAGQTKRIKASFRLTTRGGYQPLVRPTIQQREKEALAAVKKQDRLTEFERTAAIKDVRDELRVREELEAAGGPIPGVVPITEHEYESETGEIQRRFTMERFDGDVQSLIFKKGASGSLEPRPVGERHTGKALHVLCDSLSILSELHRRKFAHLDLRSANILRSGDEAKMADLASCTRMGGQFDMQLPGDKKILPLEILYAKRAEMPQLGPGLDLFAFGLALQEAYDPSEAEAYDRGIYDSQGRLGPKDRVTQHCTDHVQRLRGTGDPIKILIADLLDPNPAKRPKSAGDVQKRLSKALAKARL